MTASQPYGRPWTEGDQALLYTCHLAADLRAGRPMTPAAVSVPFRPQLTPSEQFLATGPGVLMAQTAPPPSTPHWEVRHRGWLTVSDEGIYLQDAQSLLVWDWPMLHAAQMVGVNQLSLTVLHPEGPVAWWLLQSPYAELAFVVWAHAMHIGHPQLADDSWLPPGWLAWAHAQGRAPALPAR